MTVHTNTTGPAATGVPVVPGDLFARHQTIAGLRALADFLEANPGVPVKEYAETYHVPIQAGDDASEVALVDQAAALLGVTVDDNRPRGGHYIATRTFGRISYTVFHIPDRQKADSLARDSYRDNIVLGSGHNTERTL